MAGKEGEVEGAGAEEDGIVAPYNCSTLFSASSAGPVETDLFFLFYFFNWAILALVMRVNSLFALYLISPLFVVSNSSPFLLTPAFIGSQSSPRPVSDTTWKIEESPLSPTPSSLLLAQLSHH